MAREFDDAPFERKRKPPRQDRKQLNTSLIRYRQCSSGKVSYESRKIASEQANRVGKFHSVASTYYKRKECHAWHLTRVKNR